MATSQANEYGEIKILKLVPGVNGRMTHYPDYDTLKSSPRESSKEDFQDQEPPLFDLGGTHTYIDQPHYTNGAGQLCHACEITLKNTKDFNNIGTAAWVASGQEKSRSDTVQAQYCCLCRYVFRARQFVRERGLQDDTLVREKPAFYDLTESALLLHDDDTNLEDTEESLRVFQVKADKQIRTVQRNWANCSMVRHWLDECEQEHGDKCNSHRRVESEPAHLLLFDVVEDCLVTGSFNDRYYALSYVWGASGQFLTLLENYATLCRKGSVSTRPLTQTIRDAITFIRCLGERFLWVDTLCIIQDDYENKAAAVLQMSAIYGHAVATIVAVSGQSADAGLPGIPPTLRNKTAASVAPGLHLVQHLALRHMMTGVTYSNTESVYSSRAWTYQERLLSSRTIYFTSEQVYFQCKTSLRCEAKRVADTIERTAGLFTLEHIHTTESLIPREPFAWYGEIVAEYTTKRMGYSEDILNAFRGIQTALQSIFGWTYHAGLPVPKLDSALLWTPTDSLTRRISKSRFPSWCWSGWSGAVNYSAILHTETHNLEQWDLIQSLATCVLLKPDIILLLCDSISLHSLTVRAIPPTLSDPHEITPYPANSHFLFTPASQRCGLLIGTPDPSLITSQTLRLIRLSRWRQFYAFTTHGPRIGFPADRKMLVENLFHSALRDEEWCTANVMLIRPVERGWERVAVGVLHDDVFWAAGPRREVVVLK